VSVPTARTIGILVVPLIAAPVVLGGHQ